MNNFILSFWTDLQEMKQFLRYLRTNIFRNSSLGHGTLKFSSKSTSLFLLSSVHSKIHKYYSKLFSKIFVLKYVFVERVCHYKSTTTIVRHRPPITNPICLDFHSIFYHQTSNRWSLPSFALRLRFYWRFVLIFIQIRWLAHFQCKNAV